MKKIIISKEYDPFFNIAAENQLFLDADEDLHLYLWQNEPSVIIGRNQNIYAECNLEYLKEQGIKVVRRFSGGGAVYHDKGNINFTFITKEKESNQLKFIKLIQATMANLGIECEFSGKNDLLYKNQKFSGHAYYTDGENFMYHGTILVHVDFDKLAKALTPSVLKLKSKGIESVRSRVVNLSSIHSEITIEKVIQAFMETFECRDIEYINKNSFTAPLESMLSSYDWLYGQSPNFDIELERRYSFGNVSVRISNADGRIQNVKINTDSLSLHDFKSCEEQLTDRSFSEQNVWDCIEEHIASLA